MAFSYSISYGIAGGFITYCLIKTCKGKAKEVHPVILGCVAAVHSGLHHHRDL